jgi:hypothetical protein
VIAMDIQLTTDDGSIRSIRSVQNLFAFSNAES